MELRIGSCAEEVCLPGSVMLGESFSVCGVHAASCKYRSNSLLVCRGICSPQVRHRWCGAALLPCLNKSISSSPSPLADIFAPSVFQSSHLSCGQSGK